PPESRSLRLTPMVRSMKYTKYVTTTRTTGPFGVIRPHRSALGSPRVRRAGTRGRRSSSSSGMPSRFPHAYDARQFKEDVRVVNGECVVSTRERDGRRSFAARHGDAA